MAKILITGNGFDLSLGLPTSYTDFIKILSFIKNSDVYDFDSVYSQINAYDNLIKNFNAFNFDLNDIKKIKSKLEKNLWFDFFCEELRLETWIDFENKIEYVLTILFSSINLMKENLFSKKSIPIGNLHIEEHIFNNNFEVIGILSTLEVVYLTDKGMMLNPLFLTKKYGYFININLDEISDKLINELNQFKEIFNLYFEIFIFPFYDNNKIDYSKSFEFIHEHYTFNYTPSFKKIYEGIETTYIHGKIDSNENKIVLGISEIPNSKIENKYFIPFTKYFQKLNNDKNYKFITSSKHNKQKNIFIFFGHSLDTSDKDYIDEIFDFIVDVDCALESKIIVIYHNEYSKGKLLQNLLIIRDKYEIQELMDSERLVFLKNDSEKLKKVLELDRYFRGKLSL